MSIPEMQACLARLYVNEPFRKLFYLDPSAALEGYRLTPEESDAIRKLDREELDRFANSLVSKRRKRVERAFPLLFALDGAAMRRYYWRFCQLYPARPHQASHQEVVDFGEFIEESLVLAENVPAYASDVARYERLCFLATTDASTESGVPETQDSDANTARLSEDARPSLDPDVHVADFAYDVAEIEESLQREHVPKESDVANSCSIIFRPATCDSDVHMLRINAPTKTILVFCNGRHTVAEIVADTEIALGANDLKNGVLLSINRLLASNVLVLNQSSAARKFQWRLNGGAVQIESM